MSYRLQRLGKELQKSIAEIIKYKVKDPKVSDLVSVLEVKVSKDLQIAKVKVSIFGDNKQDTFEALKNSAGFIRKEVAVLFKDIRNIPQLIFELDNTEEYVQHINKLIEEINKNNPKNEN